MSIRRRSLAPVAAVLACLTIGAISVWDPADQVNAGMSEPQVLAVLGPPTLTMTAKSDIAFYVGRAACAESAARGLFYDRWFRLDVVVAFGSDGKVACLDKTLVLTRVHS